MNENIIWQRSDLKFIDNFLFNEETEYDKDFYRLIFYETYLKETLNDIDFNPSLVPLESNFSNLNNNTNNNNNNNNNDQSGYPFINLCSNFCFKLLTFNKMKENSEFVSDKNNNNNNNDAILNLKFWSIENYLDNNYTTNKQAPKKKLLKLDQNEKNDLLKNLTQFTENNERKFDILKKNDSDDDRTVTETETDFDQTGLNLNFLNLKNNLNNSLKMDKNRVDLVNQTLPLVTSNKNVRSSNESSKKSSLGDSLINEAFLNLGVNLSDISTCSGSFSFKLSNHESSCNSLSNRTI